MQLNLILLAVICVVTVHGASNFQRNYGPSQPEHRVRRGVFDDWSDEDESDGAAKPAEIISTTQSTTTESTTKKPKGSSSKGSSSKGSSSKGSSSKGSSSKGSSSKGSSKTYKKDDGETSYNSKSYDYDDEGYVITPSTAYTSSYTSTTNPTTTSTSTISTSRSTTNAPRTTSATAISTSKSTTTAPTTTSTTSKSTTSAPTTTTTSTTRRVALSAPKSQAIEKPKPKQTLAAAYIERQNRYIDQFESQLSLSQFQMAYASLIELQRRIRPLLETLSALLGRECRILWPYLSYDTSTLRYCKTSKKDAEAQLVAFENLLLLSRSYREGAESVKDLTAKMHEKYARAMKDSLRDVAHDGGPDDLPNLPASFAASAPSNFFEGGQFGFQQPNPLPTETQVIISMPSRGFGIDRTAPSPADNSLPAPDISDAFLPSPEISNSYESSKHLDASPLPTTGSPKETLTPPNATDIIFESSHLTALANETQESAPAIYGDYDYDNDRVPGPATTLQEAQEEINKTLAEPIGNPILFRVASLLATIPDIYSQLSYIPPIINHVINSSTYRLQVTQQNRKYFLYVDSNLTMQATEASVDRAEIPVGSLWKFVPHKHNEVFLFFNVERRVIVGAQDAWDGKFFKSNSSFVASPMPPAEDPENDEDIRPSFMWTLTLECDDQSNEVDSSGTDTCAVENLYLVIQNSEFHNLKVTMDKNGRPILRNDPISPRIDVVTID